MAKSGQKFIAKNRAPRVQIEYDVELYGAEKKVQLPFVMGVMSDLSGKSNVDQGSVSSRKFLEIDVDNFDERMKSVAPRAAFTVPNTLTGEGNASIDLTFEKMSDFEPGAIAARVEHLAPLLEARQQLTNLMTYMDGKAGAENLIEKILADPALLSALAGGGQASADEQAAALAALRGAAPAEAPTSDDTADALDALRAVEVAEEAPDTSADDALDALKAAAPTEVERADTTGEALDALRTMEVPAAEAEDDGSAALDALRQAEVPETPEDNSEDTLEALRASDVPEEAVVDDSAAALASLPDAPVDDAAEDDPDDVLAGLEPVETPDAPRPGDMVGATLAGLEPVETPEDPSAADALNAALAGVETVEEPMSETSTDDVLAGIEVVEDVAAPDDLDDVLAGLEAPDEAAEAEDDLDALLADLEAPQAAVEDTNADDILAELDTPVAAEEPADDVNAILADIDARPDDETPEDDLDALLAGLEAPETTADPAPEDDLDSLLADLGSADVGEADAPEAVEDILAGIDDAPAAPQDTSNDLDDILADLEAEDVGEDAEDDLDALLADLGDAAPAEESTETDNDLDSLLADLGADDVGEGEAEDDLDALLADLGAGDEYTTDADASGDLDALLADLGSEEVGTPEETDDLEAILAGLDTSDDAPAEAPADDLDALLADLEGGEAEDDLDALLAGLEGDAPEEEAPSDDLDALLAGLDDETPPATDEDIDAMLSDLETPAPDPAPVADPAPEPEPEPEARADEPVLAFGEMTADRPTPQRLERKRFRLAIMGDFTGRAARGAIEVGDALAAREPILLDPDTIEDVIEGFGTTLMLPIGKDGAAIEVKLRNLDDLHPDELYENVALFSALKDLKSQLSHGATAENAAKSLKAWGETFGRAVAPAKAVSGGNTVRADLKLSDFQKLIGDTGGELTQASPLDDMLARIIGPHIRKLPDPNATAMAEAVDAALSGAMRLVLHHPEFQSIEAQWRALDLIARSVEVDDTLEVMLYDISAEEIAADLTQSDDLSGSGFMRLLTEGPMDEETGRGAYSALMGLYTFEETPPHAHLLGRIARVAAHVDAPFFAAITPGFIETAKGDRHPLVATAWDTLRAMPEAGHLALASPRFLLRRPYGAKTEPIYEFEFEEFTESAGLSGMLWANPVVLVSILLAKSFKENGPKMQLGQIMSLGDMPYHYVNDRYGDQVALPCTERNLTLDKIETVVARGYLPVISIKGRDEIRLGSFQSLAGAEILGPWADAPPPPPSPPEPPQAEPEETAEVAPDPAPDAAPSLDDELDALLSGFDLDAAPDEDQSDDDMDAELAALLADL